MELPEGIKAGLDAVAGAAALSWIFLVSLADSIFDVLSGRQLPEPDLKSVAEAPEPGAVSRVRPLKVVPRPSRGAARRDDAA